MRGFLFLYKFVGFSAKGTHIPQYAMHRALVVFDLPALFEKLINQIVNLALLVANQLSHWVVFHWFLLLQ
jgi:hypothetical protein